MPGAGGVTVTGDNPVFSACFRIGETTANMLDRQLKAAAPNQRWAADFTYIRVGEDLAVSGGRSGSLQSPRSGLVNERADNRSVRADCWDNAAVESFFSTLKLERVNRRRYATRDEAHADLLDHIGGFYNSPHKHSTLENISPAEFERRLGN